MFYERDPGPPVMPGTNGVISEELPEGRLLGELPGAVPVELLPGAVPGV